MLVGVSARRHSVERRLVAPPAARLEPRVGDEDGAFLVGERRFAGSIQTGTADLGRLFQLLSERAIRPHIAERIDLDGVLAAHRRIEEGGLDGKIIICPA